MQDPKPIEIVFVRHAHRHKLDPRADNGLSDKGREQVQELLKAYEKGKIPSSTRFWSSPKLRCVETLKPLSDKALSQLKIEKLLDEQRPDENQATFIGRVSELVEKTAALNETVYLCSHGDVIPEAVNLLTGKVVDVSKGQAIIIAFENGKWNLT